MPERPPPFVLVVNPRAGAGRARDRMGELKEALREAGATFEVMLTRGPGHATTLVRDALRAGATGVAVVGGDGTLNEAVNGFFDEQGEPVAKEAWLGPLPIGTGGDFRRTLGIKKNVNAMATRMLWAAPRRIDVGWLRFRDHEGREAQRAFVNIASFGMAGRVDQLVHQSPSWLGGTPAYLLSALRAGLSYKSPRVRITIDDGEPRETSVVNLAVANGRFFGGGMEIAPGARIDDGLFEVVGLENLSFVGSSALMPHLYRGTILEQDGVTHAQAKRVRAEPADWDGPVLLDVDGEAPGTLPAAFEIRPGALLLRG